MDLRAEPGFLNTGASLLADITLLAYIFLIIPAMLVGFVFARRKMFEPYHKFVMTGITLFNWVLIFFIMAVSYGDSVAPNVPDELSDRNYLIPTIHLLTGGLAQLLATYLVIRMWFEKQLPDWFKVKNIKLFMRTTLALWLITALLGIGIYFTWYGSTDAQTVSPDDTDTPAVTEEPSSASTEDVSEPVATDEPEDNPEPVVTEEPENDDDNDDNDDDDDDGEPASTEESN